MKEGNRVGEQMGSRMGGSESGMGRDKGDGQVAVRMSGNLQLTGGGVHF